MMINYILDVLWISTSRRAIKHFPSLPCTNTVQHFIVYMCLVKKKKHLMFAVQRPNVAITSLKHGCRCPVAARQAFLTGPPS